MIAIILVNWNGWQDTVGCIRSCLALEGVRYRIVVCDNASADGSVEKILDWAEGRRDVPVDPDSPVDIGNTRLPKGTALLTRAQAEAGEDGGGAELLIVETGANLGFAGGNNVGLRWALAQGATHAWLLNNDTEVPADALATLKARMDEDAAVGLCGSTMVEFHRPGHLQAYAGAIDLRTFRGRHLGAGRLVSELDEAMREDPPRADEVIYPIGASMLASERFLREIGLMEENYFLYYEEADWVLRAQGKFRVAIASQSLVYHKVGASAGSLAKGMSAGAAGFLYRSRLLIAKRFARSRARVIAGIFEDMARAVARGRRGKAIGAWRALTGKVQVPAASGRVEA